MQRTVPAGGPMPAESRQLEFALQQEVHRAQAALQKCCADNRMPADDDRSGIGAAALLFPGLGDALRIIAKPGRRARYRQVHVGSVLSEPPPPPPHPPWV